VCAVFGRVWCGFLGVIVCCVGEFVVVWGSMLFMCAGEFGEGLGE